MDTLDKPIKELIKHLPQVGRLKWIGVREKRRAQVKSVDQVRVEEKTGLEGDHFSSSSKKRQVTLIQEEHLLGVASFLEMEEIDPALARRNLLVSGINLLALRDQKFRIGSNVILEGTGYCHPCSRMEENLGEGGYNAMRGHGGITARVIEGGQIQVGDKISLIAD